MNQSVSVEAKGGLAGDAAVSPPSSSVDAMAKARDIGELERIRRAVVAVGEATYHWDIASDKIVWSRNVSDIIQTSNPAQINSGRSYADLLDADNFTSRFDTVMRSASKDTGQGVAFAIEYLMHPQNKDGRQSLWVEDCGRWYAGPNGRPAEVFGVVRQIDDRHERDQQLQFLGNCDPLTGMMNRGRLSDALAETLTRSETENTCCAFLIAIINNLAVVNDAYGFDIADEVIVSVGNRLRRVVRTGDLIGRYSGAKFGIILNDCTEEEIKIAAERFLSVARDSVIETERGPVWAMLSIGGIILPKFASDANTAMARAEEALAEAKCQPSDSFIAYQPSAERISVRGLNARCAAEIVSSLKEDRFTLAFQPIVDAKTGEVAMHEALLRMQCNDGDSVAAQHLIPIAEKLGLVRLIDRAVVRMAVNVLAANPDISISLNVSGITATDPRWFGQLTAILSETPGVTDRILVEITETVALHNREETIRFTRALRELGCRVAIDDFGAGYTSFKNLKELDVDMVKIDGSFCEGLAESPDNQYFVRSMIDLAKKFNLLTVAEWVQTEEDAELLRSWGIDYLQGNLFGQALIDVPWAPDKQGHNKPVSEDVVAFDASLISVTLAQEPAKSEPADTSSPAEQDQQPEPPKPQAAPAQQAPAPAQGEPDDGAGIVFNAGNVVAPASASDAENSPDEPFVAMSPQDTPAIGDPEQTSPASSHSEASGTTEEKPESSDKPNYEPVVLEIDQSLLKTAVSLLDDNFGPDAKKPQDPKSDVASAIAETFGSSKAASA